MPLLLSRLFESVVKYFDAFLTLIPLSFVLGFYVSFVASRWWQQFLAIPWPDKLYHSLALYIPGFDEESRMLRRCLIRYILTSTAIANFYNGTVSSKYSL